LASQQYNEGQEEKMKLSSLKVSRYRSLREETVHLGDLNLFIGTNASGKSSILDALRFLHEGVLERDFREAVHSRGGIVHIAWKGEEARQTGLTVRIEGDQQEGTRVICESQPASVRQALEASGFGLGEFYETKGFGG
jgi:predicted ATPase